MKFDFQGLMQEAMVAHQAGDTDRVIEIAQSILLQDSTSLPAKLLVSIGYATKGRTEEAIQGFQELIRIDASCQPAFNWLAVLMRDGGSVDAALPLAEQSAKLAPNSPDALMTLGLCFFDLKRFAEAAKVFRQASKLSPQSATLQSHLASALHANGQTSAAVIAARRSVEMDPSVEELCRLGELETVLGNAVEALDCFRRVVEADPSSALYRIKYAQAFKVALQLAEADEQLRLAEAMEPTMASVFAEQGFLLQSQGKFDLARPKFEKALELNPSFGLAYFGIVSALKVKDADQSIVETMRRLVEDGLPPEDEIHIQYAIGKSLDDLGSYEQALEAYDRANELARDLWLSRPFDIAEYRSESDSKIATFTSEFLEKNRSFGSESEVPVFVVGMMRSGTTLTEQLLTSHPAVGGVGEQAFWASAQSDLIDPRFGTLNGRKLASRTAEYLTKLEAMAPGKRYVIDKNPANVLSVGLIHLAYPNAKIIHVKRHPIDTAMSIYMTPVQTPPPFGCSRANIVFAYREYLRLYEHWKRVIPAENLFEVEYEQIIRNGRESVSGVLEFLGLDWTEDCLHPELNSKSVATPSFWQVRQPLFSSSIERWKRYEPWLGAFRALI